MVKLFLNYVHLKLKWFVAKDEMEKLDRLGNVVEDVERWNAGLIQSAETATYIRQVVEGETGEDISRFRNRLNDYEKRTLQ